MNLFFLLLPTLLVGGQYLLSDVHTRFHSRTRGSLQGCSV